MSASTALAASPLPPPTSNWTFTQGFLLGQASFLILVLVFIRYVVFSPADDVDEEGYKKRRAERAKRSKLSTTGVPAPAPVHILGKTGYDMATHPAESTNWLNVLFAQMLQGYRNDLLSEGGEEGARQRIEKWLNPENGAMSWLDPIQVTALQLGSSYPLLSNARIRPSDGFGHIRAEIDIDYLDSVSLSLSTSVLINFPRPRFAVLPVALGVELVSIGGTLSLDIHDPFGERQHLHACLLPDFHLNLKTTTLLGSRAKLQDIPKLEQLILSRLRAALQERLVHPRHLSFALPRLLSPSISPTPLINDIGEGAVSAMSDALYRGMSQMVDDFVHPTSDASDLNAPQSLELSDDQSGQSGGALINGGGGLHTAATSTSPRMSTKRIPMPAGFPGMSTASNSTTPLPTPHPHPHPQAPTRRSTHLSSASNDFVSRLPPSAYNQTSVSGVSAASSAMRIPQSQSQSQLRRSNTADRGGGGATPTLLSQSTSPDPNASASQFRFRGQFSSQPPTPGLGGLGSDYAASERRRVGVLNSRSGS